MVTLGMVAAISGAGGLLAANPSSWAAADEPAAKAQQTTVQETTTQQAVQRAAREAGSGEKASDGQTGQRQPVFSAEPQTSAPASAVSQGS